MTCIVAITDGERVTIGGDSAGSAGYMLAIRADVKVFARAEFVMGFTGSFRMGQLLRYNLSVNGRPEKMDDAEYMSTWFVDAVRRCLKDGGYAKVENGREQGGHFLVGYRGGIYEIESDFQCGIPTTRYAAVGCGEDFALGALHVLDERKVDAKTRIRKALAAAAAFSGMVAPPYVIVEEPQS